MNNYEKLTFDGFKKKLNDGGYQGGLTGARRAIGKTDWSEADKNKARSLAEKYFGTSSPTPVKKVAAKKGTHGSAPAKKVAAVARGKGQAKKAAKKAAPAKKSGRPVPETSPRASVEPTAAADRDTFSEVAPVSPVLGSGPQADLAAVIGVLGNKQVAGLELADWEHDLYKKAGLALSARLDSAHAPPAPADDEGDGEDKEEEAPPSSEPIAAAPPPVAKLVPPPPPPGFTPPAPIPSMQTLPGESPAIVLPKGLDPEGAATLTPEQQQQYDLLQKAGETVRRMHTPPETPPNGG